MTNKDLVIRHLKFIYPKEASNSDIVKATKIEPHQTVFAITRGLRDQGFITARQLGREWFFKAKPGDLPPTQETKPIIIPDDAAEFSSSSFEQQAREIFSRYYSTNLSSGRVKGVPKIWDLVSSDGKIVGDAKFYTLVGGVSLPPAKFSIIAEHIWLLEKTQAETKFLVFGNQIEVPKLWLDKYGDLVKDIHFFFMDNARNITTLK